MNLKFYVTFFLVYIVTTTASRSDADTFKFDDIAGLSQFEIQVNENGYVKGRAWLAEQTVGGYETKECRYSVTSDNGQSWEAPLIIKDAVHQYSGNPSVTVDENGRVFVVCVSIDSVGYQSGSLIFAKSEDAGKTWSTLKTVYNRSRGFPDLPKILVTRSGNLLIAFSDFEHSQGRLVSSIQTIISTDGGSSWSSPRRISDLSDSENQSSIDGFQGADLIQLDDQRVMVSFGKYYGNGAFVSVSMDEGLTFSPSVSISNSYHEVPVSRVTAHDRKIAIVVSEGHAFGPLVLVTSLDGGTTWTSQTIDEKGTAGTPYFASQNRLALMWTASRDDADFKLETFYSYTSEDLTVGEVFSLLGPYEIDEEVSYLGVYQGISSCNEGKNLEFTSIRWASHSLGRVESRCL